MVLDKVLDKVVKSPYAKCESYFHSRPMGISSHTLSRTLSRTKFEFDIVRDKVRDKGGGGRAQIA